MATSNKKRAEDKLLNTLFLISLWDYASQRQIANYNRVDMRGQTAFIKRMRERKLIDELPDVEWLVGEKLYCLTRKGADYLEERHDSNYKFRLDKSKFSDAKLKHNSLVLDIAIGEISTGQVRIAPPKFLKIKSSKGTKLPDAIAYFPNKTRVAIEVELTLKDEKKRFEAFINTAQNIENSTYNKVYYAFIRDTTREAYLSTFHKDEWRYYSKDLKKYITYSPSKEMMDRFQFVLIDKKTGEVSEMIDPEVCSDIPIQNSDNAPPLHQSSLPKTISWDDAYDPGEVIIRELDSKSKRYLVTRKYDDGSPDSEEWWSYYDIEEALND